jgi:transposase-like protein
MAPKSKHTPQREASQEDFVVYLRQQMRAAIRMTLMAVMEEEVTAVIGAGRYERKAGRNDRRNGTYPRDLATSVGLIEDLAVPRTRKGHQTQVFARYHRRQDELDKAIGAMFVAGASQQQVGKVVASLTGQKPSPATVSRVHHTLEAEFEQWKNRPLQAHYRYLFADGTYFSVIYDGQGHKMPILAVIGISLAGEREVLAFTVGERENRAAWDDLCYQLKLRGVRQVDLWVTDGNQAMLGAISSKFPDAARQRCVKHKLENVLGYLPKSKRDEVLPHLRTIFYQPDRQAADQQLCAFCARYEALYPTAIECLRRDADACLTFYAFPEAHWKTIRTTNVIERLFEEVKKRSHKMNAPFRNEGSCLLLFYAVIRSLHFKKLAIPSVSPLPNLHNT